MTQFWIDAFPWDIDAEGIEPALTRLRGELGVDEVRLLALGDEMCYLRQRFVGDDPRRMVQRDAAAHFRPQAGFYKATRLRPTAGSWMKTRDPFAKICSAARELGLRCSARIECLSNRALARKHEMAACVNVFGDVSDRRLCPANPDVREYVGGVAEDLVESHGATTVEMGAIGFGPFFNATDGLGFGEDALTEDLLRWCFCSACRQAATDADIDIEIVEKQVRERIDAGGRQRRRSKPIDDASSESELVAFQQHRGRVVQRLIDLVRSRIGERLTVPLDSWSRAHCIPKAAAELRFVNWERIESWRKVHDSYGIDLPGVEGEHAVRFDAMPPACADGPALVSRVHEAVEAGFAQIGFYCEGLMPTVSFDWVRQAVRYGRREG